MQVNGNTTPALLRLMLGMLFMGLCVCRNSDIGLQAAGQTTVSDLSLEKADASNNPHSLCNNFTCEVINVSCPKIHQSNGINVPVPSNVSAKHLLNSDCEQEWWNSEHPIADGTPGSEEVFTPAVNVTPQNLTVSYCLKDLWWKIACVKPEKYEHRAHYKFSNNTASSQTDTSSDHKWLLPPLMVCLFVFLTMSVLTGGFFWRRRFSRCQNGPVQYIAGRQNDPNNAPLA